MTVENVIEEQREKTGTLRHRVIVHRKRGKPSPKLERAYLRAKSELALLVRKERKERPQIITRTQWGAAKPRAPYSPRGSFRYLVRHHTAGPSIKASATVREEAAYMRQIQQGHFARGFIDIGYAKVIFPSGRVYEGRPENALGAHVLGQNHGTFGYSFAGNFDVDVPTPAALNAFKRLRGAMAARDHRQLNATACPGRHLWQDHPL